jgi:hypothetical protein
MWYRSSGWISVLVLMTVAFTGMRAPAAANSGGDMETLRVQMEARRNQLIAYNDSLAKGISEHHEILNIAQDGHGGPGVYCLDADPEKAPELWSRVGPAVEKSLSGKKGRYDGLIPGLAAINRACHHSDAAYRNSAFLIDYLYWNRMADLTGYEVADTLMFRDVFYEIYITAATRDLAATQLKTLELLKKGTIPPPSKKDFLTSGPMSESGVLKAIGMAITVLDPENQAAVEGITRQLNLRESSVVIFGNDILSSLQSPEDLRYMRDIYAYLITLQQDPRGLGVAHGGWKKLVALAHGDIERVIHVVGLLASMRFWELNEIGGALAARGALEPAQLVAMHDGAMAYFLLNQLDERSALDSEDGHSIDYQFFYPDSYTTKNWKIYHWFSNAHMGCQMRKQGFSPRQIRFGASSLAKAYEYLTLNLAYPSRAYMNVDPRAIPEIEGYEDVRINTEGAVYGSELCNRK